MPYKTPTALFRPPPLPRTHAQGAHRVKNPFRSPPLTFCPPPLPHKTATVYFHPPPCLRNTHKDLTASWRCDELQGSVRGKLNAWARRSGLLTCVGRGKGRGGLSVCISVLVQACQAPFCSGALDRQPSNVALRRNAQGASIRAADLQGQGDVVSEGFSAHLLGPRLRSAAQGRQPSKVVLRRDAQGCW